jgi:hypothetical protein
MRIEHSILILAASTVAMVLVMGHPGRVAARARLARSLLAWGALSRYCIPRLLEFDRRRFVLGLAGGVAMMAALNILPYIVTRDAPRWDGYQVIGFPMTFREFGGFSPGTYFSIEACALDVVIGLVAAVAMGYGWARLRWTGASGNPPSANLTLQATPLERHGSILAPGPRRP